MKAAMAGLRQPVETVDGFFNRALIALQRVVANGTSPAPHPDTPLRDGACAALVALLQVLFPEGKPRYLRDYGITMLPLAQLNAVLAPLGYAIRSTKTRSPARFVLCIDAHGEIERFGFSSCGGWRGRAEAAPRRSDTPLRVTERGAHVATSARM